MTKIIIVNSDRRTLLARIIKIAKTLGRHGYDVEMLTWDRAGTKPKIEYVEGYKVHNLRLKSINFKTWSIVPFYILWWIYAFLFLLKSDADGIHPLSLYSLVPSIPVKFLKNKVIVYDLTDFFADSFNFPSLVQKSFSWFENFCIKFVDAVIIVDEYRIKQIEASKIKNLVTVMNSPEDILFKLNKTNQNKTTIYFGGWISKTRGIEHICNAVQNLSDVELIIAGFGPDEEKVRRSFGCRQNIKFIGLISKEESLQITYNADAICAFYDPKIRINRLASPNKIFDAMMCGTVIIANKEAIPVAKIIETDQCGLLVPYGDIESIVSAIKTLKDNPNIKTELGQNGRNSFENNYDWSIMEQKLLSLYKSVIKS